MTGRNKINGFLTDRNKIYDKQEKNQWFFLVKKKLRSFCGKSVFVIQATVEIWQK